MSQTSSGADSAHGLSGAEHEGEQTRCLVRWASVALVGLPAVAIVVYLLVMAFSGVAHWGGDEGFLEIAVRDASQGDQLVGPYSFGGFAHPGPVFFYILAPVYVVFGQSPQAMELGAGLLVVSSGVGIVLVVRRFAGEWAARFAAGIISLFFLYSIAWASRPLWNVWNPNVVALVLVLALVLSAAAWSGSLPSLLGAALAGSFVAQTYVGSGLVVVFVLLLGIAGFGTRLFRSRDRGQMVARGRYLSVILAVGVVLIWLPPLVEQVTSEPGNISALYEFFVRGERPPNDRAGVREAIEAVASQELAFIVGESPPDDVALLQVAALMFGVVVAGGVTVIGLIRGKIFGAALGAVSVLATAVAFLSATYVDVPIFAYKLWWTSGLLFPAGIGLVILLADLWVRRRGFTPRLQSTAAMLSITVLALPGLLMMWKLSTADLLRGSRLPPDAVLESGAFSEEIGVDFAELLEPHLNRSEPVIMDFHRGSWPVTVRVALALLKDGYEIRQAQDDFFLKPDKYDLDSKFGQVVFVEELGNSTSPQPQGAKMIARVGSVIIWQDEV